MSKIISFLVKEQTKWFQSNLKLWSLRNLIYGKFCESLTKIRFILTEFLWNTMLMFDIRETCVSINRNRIIHNRWNVGVSSLIVFFSSERRQLKRNTRSLSIEMATNPRQTSVCFNILRYSDRASELSDSLVLRRNNRFLLRGRKCG